MPVARAERSKAIPIAKPLAARPEDAAAFDSLADAVAAVFDGQDDTRAAAALTALG